MAYVGKITAGGTTAPIAATLYGTCSTPAGTAAKVVTCADFDGNYITGMSIDINFSYANTAGSPTLNINGTGAKSTLLFSPYGSVANTIHFVYNGSKWVAVGSYVSRAYTADNLSYVLYSSDIFGAGDWSWINDTDIDGSFELVDSNGDNLSEYLYIYGLALTGGGCITGDDISTAIGNVETLLSQI